MIYRKADACRGVCRELFSFLAIRVGALLEVIADFFDHHMTGNVDTLAVQWAPAFLPLPFFDGLASTAL